MTIKDTLDVEGLPASSGLAAIHRAGTVSDAVAVGHAWRAGAVIWGKTNVPAMAGDWQSYNALCGTTNNPWDAARAPAAAQRRRGGGGPGDRGHGTRDRVRHWRVPARARRLLRDLFA